MTQEQVETYLKQRMRLGLIQTIKENQKKRKRRASINRAQLTAERDFKIVSFMKDVVKNNELKDNLSSDDSKTSRKKQKDKNSRNTPNSSLNDHESKKLKRPRLSKYMSQDQRPIENN